MTATYREFRIALYEEHLAEASFLYEQRRALLRDPEIAWRSLADWEDRLEAHIDALVVGGEVALEICRTRAAAGDFGELFAAVCVICRQLRAPLLAEALKHLEPEDLERVRALGDALKYELPDSWAGYCVRAIAQGDGMVGRLLATVIGYRRLTGGYGLYGHLQAADDRSRPDLLWALGRTAEPGALEAVRPFLWHTDQATREAAVHAALRLGDRDQILDLQRAVQADSCSPRTLALAAGRDAAAVLLKLTARAPANVDAVLGLGLLGDLSAVRPLLELLSVEPVAGAAADALSMITGAALFAEAVVLEQMEEEELFEDELAAYRATGALPKRADGQRFGTTVWRPSRNRVRWQHWLTSNAFRFEAGRRYRCGLLYHPRLVLEDLAAQTMPKVFRAPVMEELLIRYGIELLLESDMPVRQQTQVLAQAAGRIGPGAAGSEPGRWYFAGRPLAD